MTITDVFLDGRFPYSGSLRKGARAPLFKAGHDMVLAVADRQIYRFSEHEMAWLSVRPATEEELLEAAELLLLRAGGGNG